MPEQDWLSLIASKFHRQPVSSLEISRSHVVTVGDEDYSSDRTEEGVARIEDSPHYQPPTSEAPFGYWRKRRIIGHDIRIHGGVYVGSGQREAIVIDEANDRDGRPKLVDIYNQLVDRLDSIAATGGSRKKTALDEVYKIVSQYMPYDRSGVAEVVNERHVADDKKISIQAFLGADAGICRHQGLLAAYLIEKLIDNDILGGRVSIDRSTSSKRGGHAWARYTTVNNTVIIVDVARRFTGVLDKSRPQKGWFYARPEEAEN